MKTLTLTSERQYKLTFHGNQHVKVKVVKRVPRWKTFTAIALLGAVVATKIVLSTDWNDVAYAPTKIISPIAVAHAQMVSPTPTPTPTEHDLIVAEINQVFGKDAPKAFKLLSCENGRLNPNAVNTNTDTYQSKDYGIFQINNHWQGVTNVAFLTDYHINIRMAYNIYTRSGNTFKMWSCGQRLGL